MKRKSKIMLVGGAALIGGYFLLSRNAAAAELDAPTGGDVPGAGAGGETGDLWSRLVQQIFPGGGTTPLAFGAGPTSVPGGGPGSKPTKGGGSPFPIVPTTLPRPFEGGPIPRAPIFGGGKKPTPTPGRSPPVAINQNPRPAPKKTPIAVRAAQGVLGRPPTPKGGMRRALD